MFDQNDYIPNYFEVTSTMTVGKPTGGYKSNAYIIYDYLGPTNFKFAGIDGSTNKIELGHFDGTNWNIDAQTPALTDIAPTILAEFGIAKTKDMMGQPVFQ